MASTAALEEPASILFSRHRRDFRKEDINLGEKDAHETFNECKHNPPAPKAEEKKIMIDFSCDIPRRSDIGVGPDPVYYVNFGVQTQERDTTPQNKDAMFYSDEMRSFFKNYESDMSEALVQNTLSDAYTDELTMFPPDENVIGGRGDKALKLAFTIENFQYTKNKTAKHVELQPAAIGKSTTEREKIGLVIEVLGTNASFEERLKTENVTTKSNTFIWAPPEPTPIIALESSSEITVAHFHPLRPNIVIAGCMSGRVLAYDLLPALIQLAQDKGIIVPGMRERKEGAKIGGEKGGAGGDKGKGGEGGGGGGGGGAGGGAGTALLAAIAKVADGDMSFSFRQSNQKPADGTLDKNGLPLNTSLKPELEDQNEQNGVIYVSPIRMSSPENGRVKEKEIEGSHTREVMDLRWISPSSFISVSADGKMKMWDIYGTFKTLGVFLATFPTFTIDTPPPFTYLPFEVLTTFQFEKTEREKRKEAQKQAQLQAEGGSSSSTIPTSSSTAALAQSGINPQITLASLLRLDQTTEYPPLPSEVWFPLFTSSTISLDGLTTASLLSITSVDQTTVLVGTDRGQVVKRDIFDRSAVHTPRERSGGEGDESGGGGGGGGGGGTGPNNSLLVTPTMAVGAMPVYNVARHPFVPSLCLATCAGQFSIWRDGLDTPLMVSPPNPAHITCACWSPTRAAVIFLARIGGSVEVWCVTDVNDKVLTHQFTHTVLSLSLTRPLPASLGGTPRDLQLLCCGDESGRMSLLEVPAALATPSRTERRRFDILVEHETARILEEKHKDETEKEKVRLLQEKQMQAKAAAAPAPRKETYGRKDKEEEKNKEEEPLPPRRRDKDGSYVYTLEDVIIWESLGDLESSFHPPDVEIDFLQEIETPEEKAAKAEEAAKAKAKR